MFTKKIRPFACVLCLGFAAAAYPVLAGSVGNNATLVQFGSGGSSGFGGSNFGGSTGGFGSGGGVGPSVPSGPSPSVPSGPSGPVFTNPSVTTPSDLGPDFTAPSTFSLSDSIPGLTNVPPGLVQFPDIGGFPETPLNTPPPLPPVVLPDTPAPDPGDFTAHCGPASVCGGDPSGPIVGPNIVIGTGPRLVGVDALPGESSKGEAGTDGKGSFASLVNRLSFPTTIVLQYADRRPKCSGVLVSTHHVLTAAHCTCSEQPLYAFFGETLVPARVRGRGLRTSVPLKQSQPTYYDDGFCLAYASGTAFSSDLVDLAVLELDDALPLNLALAILPTDPISSANTDYDTAYIVGFGESDNRYRPGDKNFAAITLTDRICDDADSRCISGKEMIAASPPVDTCFGDSGGPLFLQNGTGHQMQLAGITSRAYKPAAPGQFVTCGEGGIYVSLEAPDIRAWLLETLLK